MKPYLPSTGTEGMWFTEKFCENCLRRANDPNAKTQCKHELKAMLEEDNKRWFYVEGEPTCTAFRDRKNKKRYPKKIKEDKRQMMLFE